MEKLFHVNFTKSKALNLDFIETKEQVKTQHWPITLDDIKLYGCGGDPVLEYLKQQ